MTLQTLIRIARPDDLAAVETLLGRSYPRLLRADYPPSVMVTVVPVLARARPELLASGRYFLVEDIDGRILGAGGYSLAGSGPRGTSAASGAPALAQIRHVATDPEALRKGVGRRLMQANFTAAAAEGVQRFDCLSTLTAVPFYKALGFQEIAPAQIAVLPGMAFPVMRMWRGQ